MKLKLETLFETHHGVAVILWIIGIAVFVTVCE